jgi:hypothetical protein
MSIEVQLARSLLPHAREATVGTMTTQMIRNAVKTHYLQSERDARLEEISNLKMPPNLSRANKRKFEALNFVLKMNAATHHVEYYSANTGELVSRGHGWCFLQTNQSILLWWSLSQFMALNFGRLVTYDANWMSIHEVPGMELMRFVLELDNHHYMDPAPVLPNSEPREEPPSSSASPSEQPTNQQVKDEIHNIVLLMNQFLMERLKSGLCFNVEQIEKEKLDIFLLYRHKRMADNCSQEDMETRGCHIVADFVIPALEYPRMRTQFTEYIQRMHGPMRTMTFDATFDTLRMAYDPLRIYVLGEWFKNGTFRRAINRHNYFRELETNGAENEHYLLTRVPLLAEIQREIETPAERNSVAQYVRFAVYRRLTLRVLPVFTTDHYQVYTPMLMAPANEEEQEEEERINPERPYSMEHVYNNDNMFNLEHEPMTIIAFNEYMDQVPEYLVDNALCAYFNRWCAQIGTQIMVLTPKEIEPWHAQFRSYEIIPHAISTYIKANPGYKVWKTNPQKPEEKKPISALTIWQHHPEHRSFDSTIWYPKPDERRIYGVFNLAMGTPANLIGVPPDNPAGIIDPILEYIFRIICKQDRSRYVKLLGTLSGRLIDPIEYKPRFAFVFVGVPGCGKNTFIDWILRLLFGDTVCAMNLSSALARFSNFHEYLWVYIDEVDEERLSDSSTSSSLKKLIANLMVPMERKGIQSRRGNNEAPNVVTLMMLCNRVPYNIINGNDGRRFVFFEVSDERANDLDYYEALTSLIKTAVSGTWFRMHYFSRWLVNSDECKEYRREVFGHGNIADVDAVNTRCRIPCLKGFEMWFYQVLFTGQINGVKVDALEVKPEWSKAPEWLKTEWQAHYGDLVGNIGWTNPATATVDAKRGWPVICNLSNLYVAFLMQKNIKKKEDFATFKNTLLRYFPRQNWVPFLCCDDQRTHCMIECVHFPTLDIVRYKFCEEMRFEVSSAFPVFDVNENQ